VRLVVLLLLVADLLGCAELFSNPCFVANQTELDLLANEKCEEIGIGFGNETWVGGSLMITDLQSNIYAGGLPKDPTSVSIVRSSFVQLFADSANKILLEDSSMAVGTAVDVDATLRCTAGASCAFGFGGAGGSLSFEIDETSSANFNGPARQLDG
jgi:hypothetical protein